LQSKQYYGHCNAAQEEGDQKYLQRKSGEKMSKAGFRKSWRKMEAAALDRTGQRQVVCGLCSTESNKV